MKGISLTGLILLAISTLLFYLTTDFTVERINLSHVMGIMGGIGIGLIIGGMIGYASKGTAIKEEEKKREFKRLQQEKLDLEKQTEELAKKQAEFDNLHNKTPQF